MGTLPLHPSQNTKTKQTRAESRNTCVTEQVHMSPHVWIACVHLHLLPSAHNSRPRKPLSIFELQPQPALLCALRHFVVNSSQKGTI